VADLARRIEDAEDLKPLVAELRAAFPSDDDLTDLVEQGKKDEVLQRLVDRHGLGRSLIRNRRARLANLFSGREVVPHEIADADESQFLIGLLRQLKETGEKVLVMVESTADVSRWAKLLAERTTLSVARFDETMSLLERDRQAAWFNRTGGAPGEDEPASVLLCSELGGEGRNFQVAHHLVLLDLPHHPDKLEQRIGRLDRIGQTQRVTVHVPLPQANLKRKVVFAWLHEGLDAFTRPLTEGQKAVERFGSRLREFAEVSPQSPEFQDWLVEVKAWTEEAQSQAEQAVDPLIDRMSFDPVKAEQLRERVEQQQSVLSSHLQDDLGELLDSLGVSLEPRGDQGLYYVRGGGMMFIEALPGLPPGGALVTFDRTLANRRDDVEFLHFEHRLVQNTLDIILDEGVGKAAAARWKGAERTTVCFQFLYVLEAEGPERLSLGRFLPVQTVILSGDLSGRVEKGNLLPGVGPIDERALERLSPDVVETLLTRTSDLRPTLKEGAQAVLASETVRVKKMATEAALSFFDREQARLSHLAEVQRDHLTELALAELEQQKSEVLNCLEGAQWRFDAVRMILCQE